MEHHARYLQLCRKTGLFSVPQQVEGQRQPAVHTAGAHQQHLRRKRQIDAEVVHLHPGPGQQHRPGEHQVEQPEPRQQPHKSPPPRPAIGRGHGQRPGAALVEQPDAPRRCGGQQRQRGSRGHRRPAESPPAAAPLAADQSRRQQEQRSQHKIGQQEHIQIDDCFDTPAPFSSL